MPTLEPGPSLPRIESDEPGAGRKSDPGTARIPGLDERWKLASRRNRQLRANEFGATFRRKTLARQYACPQPGLVRNRRVHGAGRAYVAALVVWFERSVDGVAIGQVVGKVGAPLHARVRHPETIEDPALHLRLDVQSEPRLQDELQEIESLAGVGVALSRLKVEPEDAILLEPAKIVEARGMIQHMARGQCLPAAVAGQVAIRLVVRQGPRQVALERLVEVEQVLVNELQNHVGKRRLRQ